MRKGETLAKLAKRYGVSGKKIMQQNHLKSSSLTVGQVLQLEQPQRETKTSKTGSKHNAVSAKHGTKTKPTSHKNNSITHSKKHTTSKKH